MDLRHIAFLVAGSYGLVVGLISLLIKKSAGPWWTYKKSSYLGISKIEKIFLWFAGGGEVYKRDGEKSLAYWLMATIDIGYGSFLLIAFYMTS